MSLAFWLIEMTFDVSSGTGTNTYPFTHILQLICYSNEVRLALITVSV